MKIFFNLIFGIVTEDHLAQILAGFQILKMQGKLDYRITFDQQYIKQNYGHRAIVEATSKGKVIVYDLTDGYHNIHNYRKLDDTLDSVDYYFKRSNNPELNSNLDNSNKMFSLGLNYHVSCKGNPYDKYYNSKRLKGIDLIKDYLSYLRSNKRFQNKYYYRNFESNGKSYENYNILFSCRLYDSRTVEFKNIRAAYPDLSDYGVREVVEKWKADLQQVTEQRIETVRVLKDKFGDRFIGGISRDPYSQEIASKLLIHDDVSMKYNYLKTIKENNICVSTKGLHHSIGWKFAEYVAAGKAIVSDKLSYETPGGFRKDKNYLEFNGTEMMIKTLSDLIENVDMIHKMEKNNREYYESNLRPDVLIENTLTKTGLL